MKSETYLSIVEASYAQVEGRYGMALKRGSQVQVIDRAELYASADQAIKASQLLLSAAQRRYTSAVEDAEANKAPKSMIKVGGTCIFLAILVAAAAAFTNNLQVNMILYVFTLFGFGAIWIGMGMKSYNKCEPKVGAFDQFVLGMTGWKEHSGTKA